MIRYIINENAKDVFEQNSIFYSLDKLCTNELAENRHFFHHKLIIQFYDIIQKLCILMELLIIILNI